MNNFGGNYDWTGRTQGMQQTQGPPQPNAQQVYPGQQSTMLNQNRVNYIPLQGHYVQSENNIMPKDVPMDGSAGWFPAENLSYVIMRRWNSQGTFDTILYVPYQPDQQQSEQQGSAPSLAEFMDQINARFDKLEKAVSYRKPHYQQKSKPKENDQ